MEVKFDLSTCRGIRYISSIDGNKYVFELKLNDEDFEVKGTIYNGNNEKSTLVDKSRKDLRSAICIFISELDKYKLTDKREHLDELLAHLGIGKIEIGRYYYLKSRLSNDQIN